MLQWIGWRSSIVSAQPSPSESMQPNRPSLFDVPATSTQSSPSNPELLSPKPSESNLAIELAHIGIHLCYFHNLPSKSNHSGLSFTNASFKSAHVSPSLSKQPILPWVEFPNSSGQSSELSPNPSKSVSFHSVDHWEWCHWNLPNHHHLGPTSYFVK